MTATCIRSPVPVPIMSQRYIPLPRLPVPCIRCWRPRIGKRPPDALAGFSPFVIDVASPEVFAPGVEVFQVQDRVAPDQTAVHLIGYLDGEGKGVTGLESAFDEYLRSCGGSLSVRYVTDTMGQALSSTPPQVVKDHYGTGGGIVLTIDREIQQAAEQAAARHFQRGAVVVLDVHTGEIRAMASLPAYDPTRVEEALEDPDSPLINRALLPYSVGSTFKVLVAATAIEQGYAGHAYDCPGYIQVEDVIFRCHNLAGHGALDMLHAMEKSCNPYFVSLIQLTGGESVAAKAAAIGFGSSLELADGIRASAGRLPTYEELSVPGQTANFGFGQGYLTATPLQIAQLMAAIANDGAAVTPKLIAGYTQDGQEISEHTPTYAPRQVIRESAALQVQQMMIGVVEEGSGTKARPRAWGAGGKTASARPAPTMRLARRSSRPGLPGSTRRTSRSMPLQCWPREWSRAETMLRRCLQRSAMPSQIRGS